MSTRRKRQSRNPASQEALAAAAIIGMLGGAMIAGASESSDESPTDFDPELADVEGQRLAARIFTATTDAERDERIHEAMERCPSTAAAAPTLAHALRELAGGYLPVLIARINELERNEAEPTELTLHLQALALITAIDEGEAK